MPLSRTVLERQLSVARKNLADRVELLEKAGVTKKEFGKFPAYRSLSAECLQISRRLNTVAAIEKNNEVVAARKSSGESEE